MCLKIINPNKFNDQYFNMFKRFQYIDFDPECELNYSSLSTKNEFNKEITLSTHHFY